MSFTIAGAEPDYAPDLALEPKHCEVSLRIDLEAKRAAGSVTTTVRCNRPGARGLKLNAIGFDDVEVTGPEQSRYDGEVLHLAWDEPFLAGEERTVEVRYAVQSPITGMMFCRPDEAYPDRATMMCTDHETERARYWLPCVDYPTVRPTFDFHLTAAADLTILANGIRVSENKNSDGTKTAHWKLDFPCPSYLVCLAVGHLTRFADEAVGERPIEYFAGAKRTAKDLQRSFGKTPAMMRWLEGRLGVPFPFPKYFQIAVPGIGGAMENISLVAWDDWLCLDEALQPEWGPRVDSINIHEMAHSYFGDAVVCRHFEHSWLKESWATYIETVWRQETMDRDEADYNLHMDAEGYTREADTQYVRPLVTRTYDSSWSMFDMHLYPGGAWRLHMLRDHIGDDAFWAGTQDYLETYSGGFVETEDFRRKLERHSGLNLVPFFDQWVHSKGYPKLKATLTQDEAKGEAKLVIEQTQEDKDKGIGFFRFPVTIEYETESGVERRTLELEGARTTAVLPKCTRLVFDPCCKALFTLEFDPGGDLLRAALAGDDVRNRIRAAEELIKKGKRKDLEDVRAAMAKEPFWGVRASVARALGKSDHVEAIGPLADWLGDESEPRVKRALAEACGGMRDPRLRDALLGFLENEQPPFARGSALESLGAQRNAGDLGRLTTEFDKSHWTTQSGALRGIGHLGTVESLEFLIAQLPLGAAIENARGVAPEAIGACAKRLGPHLRLRARDALIDATRDPQWRMNMTAAAALVSLGDAAAIGALESLKQRHPAEEAPRINRMIGKLKKGAEGKEAEALRERAEKLEQRCRKLDERVQDLEAKT